MWQVSRKGIVDAALLGCIPALLHRGMAQQWPWHWGDWVANATVVIDETQLLGGVQATHRGKDKRQEDSRHDDDKPYDVIAALAAIPAERVAAMRATLAQHAHRLHYHAPSGHAPKTARNVETDDGGGDGDGEARAPPKDAFDVMMEASLREARSEARRRDGAAQQARAAGEGGVEREVASHHAFTLAAKDGQCFGSTGDFGAQACSVGGPARPGRAQFMTLSSGAECVRRCEGCPACGFASFSLLLRRCTWHRPDGCNISRLDKRWELWSYSTMQVQHQ